jgi:hypothetical protein
MKKGVPIQIGKNAVGGMPATHRSAAFGWQHPGKNCHLCATICRDGFEVDLRKHLGPRRRGIQRSFLVGGTNMTGRILMLLVALAGLAGCAAPSGVVTGTSTPAWYAGTVAPDVEYQSKEGKRSSFNRVRQPVALVAFVTPPGAACCWVEPGLVNMADQLSDLPVTVAEFSEPTSKCPHGAGCTEVCNLRQGRLMSFCDVQKLAWKAYGKPAPGTLILIGPDNKILGKGSLSDPQAVVSEAKRLGQIEKERLPGPGGERIGIY